MLGAMIELRAHLCVCTGGKCLFTNAEPAQPVRRDIQRADREGFAYRRGEHFFVLLCLSASGSS